MYVIVFSGSSQSLRCTRATLATLPQPRLAPVPRALQTEIVTRSSIPLKSLRLLAAFALLFGSRSRPIRAQESAPLAKAADTAAEKPATPETPAQIELLETHIRFEANGDSRKEVHTRVRINSELGVRQFSHLNFDFNRSFEQIEIPLVHITHASGGTADILPSAITDQPNPGAADAPAYQDVRVKSVRILGLEPADVLEYRIITTTTHRPLAPDFWLDHTFDRSGVVSHELYELNVPTSRQAQIRTNPATPATPAESETKDSTRRTYKWDVKPENFTDHPTDKPDASSEPDIVVTTFTSWEQLSTRLKSFLNNASSPSIWAESMRLTGSSKEPVPDSLLYDLVRGKIKTIDLPLDFSEFPLRQASEVLSSGYGRPEEKLELLLILHGQQSLQHPVNTRVLAYSDVDSPEDQLPRPSVLKGLVLNISESNRNVYLDPSLEVAPYGMIRADLRGKKALVLGGCPTGKSRCWQTIPNELPFPSTQRVIVDAALAADGTLTAKVKYSMRGDNELLLRIAFHQSPRDKWKEVAQLLALSDGFRGKIISASASDPTVTKLPFTVEYEISQTKFVDWAKKPVRIPALLPQLAVPDLPEKAANGAAASPVDLGTPLDVDTRVTLRLPPGTSVEVPTGTVVDRDYATFVSRYNTQTGVITASRHIDFLHRQVPAGQSADYAAFLHAVQTDQSQHFTLSHTDAAAHPGTSKAATPKPQ